MVLCSHAAHFFLWLDHDVKAVRVTCDKGSRKAEVLKQRQISLEDE
jgi:hypothetical protein